MTRVFVAELDTTNVVTRVVVAPSVEWCQAEHGGTWVQTRDPYRTPTFDDRAYAGPGFHYLPDFDDFSQTADGASLMVPHRPRRVATLSPQSLTDLIAALPDGAPDNPTIADLAGAHFLSEATLRISNRHHLTLRNFTLWSDTDGAAATPRWLPHMWPRNRSHIRVDSGSSHITFEDVSVVGPHPSAGLTNDAYDAALEAQHAFDIDGCSHVTMRRCAASDVYGDFVFIRANNVTLEDCSFVRNGRQGIGVTNSLDTVMRRVRMDSVRRSMIDLENDKTTQLIDRLLIEDCTFGRSLHPFLACLGMGAGVRNVTIRRVVMNSSAGVPAIAFDTSPEHRRGPIVVEDSVFRAGNSTAPALRFQRIDGLVLRRCQVVGSRSTAQMTAAALIDCPDAVVEDVTASGFANGVVFYP